MKSGRGSTKMPISRIQENYMSAARQKAELRWGEAHAEPSKFERCKKSQPKGCECLLVDGHEQRECMRARKMSP
jgi:hypothetical protein